MLQSSSHVQPRDRVKAIVKYCTASKARRKALTRPETSRYIHRCTQMYDIE